MPIALVLLIGSLIWGNVNASSTIEMAILDSSSGEPIPGAIVIVGDQSFEGSDSGKVSFERPEAAATLQVTADGYMSFASEITQTTGSRQELMLRPNTVVGKLTDESNGEPIAGAEITLLDASGNELATASTDDSGGYRLTDVPEQAQLSINAGPYGTSTHDLDGQNELSLTLAMSVASGTVLDDEGNPLQGAVIRAGDAMTVTAGDGTYTLEGVRDGDEVNVQASGFESTTSSVNAGIVDDVQLSRQMIKAVYANINLLTTEGGLQSLIDIANTTEINAIVIDVKEGAIFYDSNVQFFLDVDTVRPTYDLEAILAELKANDIYAIARMVVFQDPLVAEARPDLAVQDTGGGLWRNVDGVAWVSAFHEELWAANIELAVELANRGFDEIQYDYVRFPSDGDLNSADFGREYTGEAREAAITEFMRRSHEAINGAGAYLAADLFGFVTIQDDEQWIGQRFSQLEPHLDFVCMMIYPSHFETGNIASAPGHPNDYPYETIFESLERAEQIVPGSSLKFRPWLQDFSYGFAGLRDYTDEDVRAQIDAAEDFGASGWMLWGDPQNVSVGALEPDPDAGA